MKILNKTVFPYATIAGRLNHPAHSLTHIIKATFDLKPGGTATLAEEQFLLSGDEYYPDDEEQKGSLFYESDFAYIKPKADVLLVGKCHTPDGKPLKACSSSFSIGNYTKKLAVYGNRYWKKVLLNPSSTEPQPFSEMDLRYERSFGGRDDSNNPVGRGACKDDVTVADNVLPVPNVQDPDDLITSPMQKKDPAGFGPLSRTWAYRQNKMGTYDKSYMKNRWPWFPDNMESSHFNAAPEDQQIADYLKGNETITFENLHPKHSKYQCLLPGLKARCFIRTVHPQTKKRSFEEIDLKLDTLWVDMEAEKLVLVWRGWMPVLDDEFKELQHIFVMAESLDEKPASIEECYVQFKKAREEEEAEFGAPENEQKEKAVSSKKLKLGGAALVTGAVTEGTEAASENTIEDVDKATSEEQEEAQRKIEIQQQMQAQMDAMFEKTGVDFSALPPEVQAELTSQNEKLIAQLVEGNSEEGLEMQIAENQATLKTELAKLNLDIDNLPPMSEKAKLEQMRFHNELGIDNASLQHLSPETENMWAIMAAVFPKIGIDPENLAPIMQQSKPQFDQLKEQIAPVFSANTDAANNESLNTQDEVTEEDSDIRKIRERAAKKEKFCNEVFDGLDLSGINFSECDLTGASFVGATLTEAVFVNAILTKTIFRSAKLTKTMFSQVSAQQTDFTQAEMSLCVAENGEFTKALFIKTKLDQGRFPNSNFSHANLASCNLNDADLENTVLDEADFSSASMTRANLTGASVNNSAFQKIIANKSRWSKVVGKDCSFANADLRESTFQSAELSYADFSKANLSTSNFSGSQLQNCFLIEVTAPNVNLSRCNLFKLRASHGSDFTGAKIIQVIADESMWADAILVNADFSESTLQRVNYIKANLSGACFYNSDLKFTNLEGAKLNGADVRYVNLMQANLGKADLTQTNFYGSNLYEVEFLDALLSETVIESANITNTKLEN